MKEMFMAVEHRLSTLALGLACIMLATASGLGVYQIIVRFILERSAPWTEVLIRFSLIWMVFLAVPYAFRVGAMLSVNVLYRWAGPRMKVLLRAMVALAHLSFMVILMTVGWDYANRAGNQTIAGLEQYSMFWAYLAIPVGAAVSLFSIVAHWFQPVDEELDNAQ